MTTRRRFAVTRVRRPMSWVISHTVSSAIAANAKRDTDLLATRSDAQRTEMTVTRTRGAITVRADSDASTEGILLGGIIVVTQQAMAVGGASIPDPEIDNADWLWFGVMMTPSSLYADAGGVERVFNQGHQFSVDSKAMRKLGEENKTLALVLKNSNGGSVVVGSVIRTLLKR